MRRHKGLWVRGDVIYFRFTDAQGNPQRPATEFRVGQEDAALKRLAAIKRQVAAERELLQKAESGEALPTAGVTIQSFGAHWNARRLKNEETHQAGTEDKWKLEYIYEFLGHIRIAEYRTRHGQDFIEWLKQQKGRRGKLGKRTIRSIWSCLHNLFRYAVSRELIPVNPVVPGAKGEEGQLPEIEDKDPEWREANVFERWEVERLISDAALPEWHQVLWALKFLAGIRDSEAYALRVSRYDSQLEPLGRLTVAKGWNTRHQKLKDTKTRKRRRVPVHPTLARILGQWLLSGWEKHVHRKPGPDDLLIPNEEGGPLRVDTMLEVFRADCAALGLRQDRDQYASRSTFKSLAEDDGASPEKIRWVMWGRRGTVEDGYSRHAWASFCEEVAKLRIQLLQGTVVQLKAAGAEIGTAKSTSDVGEEDSRVISVADTRTRTGDLLITKAFQEDNPAQSSPCKAAEPVGIRPTRHRSPDPTSAPLVPLCQLDRRRIAIALEAARIAWADGEPSTGLRARLLRLLALLPERGGA